MTLRNYSNNAPPQALTADLAASGGATTAYVASTSGYPTAPFITGLERGTDNQEVALCTGTTGTTLTLIRGYDGTSPLLHTIGATLEHTSSAIDYSQPNAFINLMTTLGDILVLGPTLDPDTGTYVARLGVGPDGTSLTANSGATNGVDWEQTIPSGTITAFGGSGAPAGWVKCDGTSYVRTGVYANLFTALGGTGSPWGLPDGTHFKVPNLQGMTLLGVGTGTDVDSATKAITLATLYGEYNHTLSGGEMPTHNHTFGANTGDISNGHDHTQASVTARELPGSTEGLNAPYNAAGVTFSGDITSGQNAGHTHYVSGTTSNAGSGGGHNNVQPGRGVTFIIKL